MVLTLAVSTTASAQHSPQVSSVTPVHNEMNVAVSENVKITFNLVMNEASLNDTTIIVTGSQSGYHTGSVSYFAIARSATFTPDIDFALGEVVYVLVTTGVQSSLGFNMASNYAFNFSIEGGGGGTFPSSSEISMGELVKSVYAADYDGDGDLDLAVTSQTYYDSVVVRLNNGDGTFASSTSGRLWLGDGARDIFSADFDGDGDLDLVTANSISDDISVIRNEGAGTFSGSSYYAAGDSPWAVFAADLDTDGDVDIIAANRYDDNVSVFLNNGDGTFAADVLYWTGTEPTDVYAADLDGDRDLDIVTANRVSDDVHVRLNNGDGTFATSIGYSVDNGPEAIHAADLDGDGDLDIAVANNVSRDVVVMLNNGDGTFVVGEDYSVAHYPCAICAGDFDDDGDIDVATASYVVPELDRVSVLLNDGDDSFAPYVAYVVGDAAGDIRDIITADFDGDGDLDLATANFLSGGVTILWNFTPAPSVASTSPYQNELNVNQSTDISVTFNVDMDEATIDYSSFVVSARSTGLHAGTISYDNPSKTATFNPTEDFDEGELVSVSLARDIESAQGSAMDTSYVWCFTVVAGEGSAEFAEDSVYATGTLPQAVHAADLDGDGDIDLATANRNTHNVSVLLSNGDGTFDAHSTYPVTYYPISLFAADFDTDGDIDLATTSSQGDNVSILLNNGNGTFASHADYTVANSPFCMTGGDLDGDGDMDLLTGNLSNLSVIWNNGNGSFTAHADYLAGSSLSSVYAFDSDGDGDLDIAATNVNNDTVTLLTNNGDGVLTLFQTYPVGGKPSSIFAADLDDDGDLDMSVANRLSNTVSVLMNNGDGTFAAQVVYSAGIGPVSIFAADLDGDGDLDLTNANYNSKDVTVLLNDESGTFTDGGDYATGEGPYNLFVADLDGDNALDLAVVNLNTSNLSVLLNLDVFFVSLPITATGVDISFVSGLDTLAILNFASETLDSLRIGAYIDAIPPNIPAGTDWVHRYYEITPYPPGATFEADIILFYAQEEFDASGLSDESLLHMYRYDDAATEWEIQFGILDAAMNSVSCNGVTEFSIWAFTCSSSLVGDESGQVPTASALYQNYPNPFNPATQIKYVLHRDSDVKLAVYDVLGRNVVTLVNGRQTIGYRTVTWNGRDGSGNQMASGIYFYRLVAGDFVQTKKMVLLR